MTKNWKISLFKVFFIFLSFGWVLYACSPSQAGPQMPASSPTLDAYTEAFTTYAKQLEQEGLTPAKEIRVEESQPFIFILTPKNQEITAEEVENVTELVLRTVTVFENGGGLKHDDIEMAFHRPTEQKILLIKRRTMPEALSADKYGEVTTSIDSAYFRSLVNLAGPAKNDSQDFANAWSVVQAVCLAYAGDFEDSDPVCNIISANAAAGWVGMEREAAEDLINSYGMTDLGYLGNQDYRYRFIDFVYEGFVR